jgi:hypothetical protein
MLGVISKPDQVAVVEEFFELFKTPWEFYVPGRRYDAVISTADDVAHVDARLLVAYGADSKTVDERNGVTVHLKHRGGLLEYGSSTLPIYSELALFEENGTSKCCLGATGGIAGLRMTSASGSAVVRVGYDLFEEVRSLLSTGQGIEHAHTPALDMHIDLIRRWILSAGIPFIEVAPTPPGHSFIVCLTHDIDFVGIRNHKLDHTMWGFLYRATIGGLRGLLTGRIALGRVLKMWRAAASLPLVHLGWVEDFWDPFTWYLNVEKGLPATYYLIPFKGRVGEHVPGDHAGRRAAPYEVQDIRDRINMLCEAGCELGVHGIDAWHSAEKGRTELGKLSELSSAPVKGIRMHWLLHNENTAALLDEAGYGYDSTSGYNETIGYRNGTAQVFRPLGSKNLLELPMHIQDGALFFENRLNLSEAEAEKRCKNLIENVGKFGGVLTLLWHDRSHGPERFWGDFYISLVEMLKSSDAWFATAAQATGWFQKRREVRFERIGTTNCVRAFPFPCDEREELPQLCLRVYRQSAEKHEQEMGAVECTLLPWSSRTVMEFDSTAGQVSECAFRTSPFEVCR